MRITVVGMSHVGALRRALPPDQDRIEAINVNQKVAMSRYVPGGEWLDANKSIKPRFKASIRRDGHFVSMIGGNMHNMIGLIEHPRRYDFLAPGRSGPPADPERELIPYDAMRAHLEASLEPYFGWIAELAGLFPGRRLHLASPPPIPSSEHIERFPGLFRAKIALGVAPAATRLKLHELKWDIDRQRCAALGVDWLPPPAESMDAAGFLKDEYWDNDPTHGNEAYGRLLLRQIEEALP